MNNIYKPSNLYIFFDNKISNILTLLIPIPFIYANSSYKENNLYSQILYWLSIISLIFILKPLISFIKNRKVKYVITDMALEIHHPVLIGDRIESYIFGKMTIELENKIIIHSIKIDDFTPENNESILWIRNKKECRKIYDILQEQNSIN